MNQEYGIGQRDQKAYPLGSSLNEVFLQTGDSFLPGGGGISRVLVEKGDNKRLGLLDGDLSGKTV